VNSVALAWPIAENSTGKRKIPKKPAT
jgi:hypothetical protein